MTIRNKPEKQTQDASCKDPVHLALAVDLSQMSFFQRGTVKEITALVTPSTPSSPLLLSSLDLSDTKVYEP